MKRIFILAAALMSLSVAGQNRKPALDTLLRMTDTVQQKIRLEKMLLSGDEDELETLVLFYNVKKNWEMRDSVIYSAARRFPLGDYAFEAARMNINKIEDPLQQWEQYLAVRKKFAFRGFDDMGFGMMEHALVMQRIEEKDLKGAIAYMDSIRNPMAFAFAARELYSLNPGKAEELLRNFISKYGTASQQGRYDIAAAYGNILIRNGKIKEAAPFVKEAYEQAGRYRSAELSMDYAKVLSAGNDFEGVINVLEDIIRSGQGTPEARAQLEEAYKKTNRNASASFNVLNEELSKRIREEVAPKIINKPSPGFTVKDASGKPVSLDDFKGKVVILDFWATWCVPCKKSFPAMQQALNRYKKDKDVAFLFIHTWERKDTAPQKSAAKYLKDNKYSFDLYMDLYDPVAKLNPAVSAFDVKGIPTKFVIDGKGNIRFIVSGYSGYDEATVEEMSAMIEMSKSN